MSLTVARRYARALVAHAEQAKSTNDVDSDVELIQASLEGSAELRRFFSDPMIGDDKKQRVVTSLFEKRVHEATFAFLGMLIEKGREPLLASILDSYNSIRNKQRGIIEAQVRVALPMSSKEENKIQKSLEAMTGLKVEVKTEIDPSIMGGIIIRVGDTVYDGSVNHQLTTLKDRLATSTYLAN